MNENNEQFTQEEFNKLKTEADKIQPDTIRDKNLAGATENDGIFYDSMVALYKLLCEKDVAFNFTFLLPESRKSVCFFRSCEPDDKQKYEDLNDRLAWAMYQFLCWVGSIKSLEKMGYIKILPKGEHKTWQEEVNFKVENKEDGLVT